MRIIKRNGSEEDFNIEKIINAVKKANGSGEHKFLTDEQIEDVADYVEYKCNKIRRAVSVEEIQDMVEDQLMAKGAFELARRYVRYRYNRSLVRKANTTDNRILSLIECNNEEVKQEMLPASSSGSSMPSFAFTFCRPRWPTAYSLG